LPKQISNFDDLVIFGVLKNNEYCLTFGTEKFRFTLDLSTENSDIMPNYEEYWIEKDNLIPIQPVIYKGEIFSISKNNINLFIYNCKTKYSKIIEGNIWNDS